MNIQKELIKYQTETAKRFNRNIPLSTLKEYINTLETLEINELSLEIINTTGLPEHYCLVISEEHKLVNVEVNHAQKQPRYIDAKFSLQPVKIATLVLNNDYTK